MAERGAAILTFAKGSKTGNIDVNLPAAFDPAWQRDGVNEKAVQGTGMKQWWAQQILSAVPPTHWSSLWKEEPSACVIGLSKDFAGVVTAAWTDAAKRNPDAAWIRALVLHPVAKRSPQFDLLNALRPTDRQMIVAEYFSTAQPSIELTSQLLQQSQFSFDVANAKAIAGQIDRHAASVNNNYDYRLAWILESIALRFPPALISSCRPAGRPPTSRRGRPIARRLDACLQTLQLRHDIQAEFAS